MFFIFLCLFYRRLPGTTFSDALIASYAMATDASKWDINKLLSMCNDQRFKPEDITFHNLCRSLLQMRPSGAT